MKNESNVPLTPAADGEYASGETHKKQQKKTNTVSLVVALFLLANIVVLYVLHFADRGSSSGSSAGAVAAEFKKEGLSTASVAKAGKGKAVSLGADGLLTVGAGTSAYLDAVDLSTIDKAVTAIRFAPLSGSKDAAIMSYQTGAAPNLKSVLTTVSADAEAKTVSIGSAEDANTFKGASIKGLATLSASSLVVLNSVASADGMAITVYATPASIADGKIKANQDGKVLAANNSATNFITRVSDSSFAVAFYEPYSESEAYFQRVEVGSVSDGKISFSQSLKFGSGNSASLSTTVGQPQGVFNSSDRFTVPWFVDNMAATKDNATFAGAVGLCLSTFNFAAKTANLTSLGDACQTQYLPAYFVESVKLSDTTLALVFVDRANKFALTVATVQFSPITGQPTFRGSYVLADATGAFDFGAAYGFYPKPTVRLLSNNRLAVGFLNPSNSGKPSVKVLKFASDLSMEAVSPSLPISNADFSVASADPKAFGAIVMDIAPLSSGFVAAYAGSYAGAQYQRVAFVESLGKPLGVISDVDGSEFDIAMSGTVDVDSLTSGRAYYAATNGQIYSPSTNTDSTYVLANDNKIVLSKDALVGVAVSSSKLFVSAQAN